MMMYSSLTYRSSIASSVDERPSVMAPFHIRPSTDEVSARESVTSERTTSDFSVRMTDTTGTCKSLPASLPPSPLSYFRYIC